MVIFQKKPSQNRILDFFDLDDDSFDLELYLALNPELDNNSINPFEHWVKHGKKEQRLATKSAFSVDSFVHRDRLLSTLENLNGQYRILKFLRVEEKILLNVPWTLGAWGRPSSLLVLRLISNLPLIILKRLNNVDWQISRIGLRELRIYIPLGKELHDS